MNNPYLTEIAKLRGQLDDANGLLKDLRKMIAVQATEFYHVAGLTTKEAQVAGVLASRGRLSLEQLIAAVWGDVEPTRNTVVVTVSKARAKLKRHGIDIVSVWAFGYEMSRESAGRLRALAKLPCVESPPLQAAA